MENVHCVECSPAENTTRLKFLAGTKPEGADLRFTDHGFFQVATEGMGSEYVVGELWISYDVTLFEETITGQASVPVTSLVWQQTNADTYGFGTLGYPPLDAHGGQIIYQRNDFSYGNLTTIGLGSLYKVSLDPRWQARNAIFFQEAGDYLVTVNFKGQVTGTSEPGYSSLLPAAMWEGILAFHRCSTPQVHSYPTTPESNLLISDAGVVDTTSYNVHYVDGSLNRAVYSSLVYPSIDSDGGIVTLTLTLVLRSEGVSDDGLYPFVCWRNVWGEETGHSSPEINYTMSSTNTLMVIKGSKAFGDFAFNNVQNGDGLMTRAEVEKYVKQLLEKAGAVFPKKNTPKRCTL